MGTRKQKSANKGNIDKPLPDPSQSPVIDEPLRLDMTFEDAMRKALNTPIPKNKKEGTRKK